MANPLQQFEIVPKIPLEVGGYDISFTNSSIWMVVVLTLAAGIMFLGVRKMSLVPGRWQNLAELLYETIEETLVSSAGAEARKFVPIMLTVFLFILLANLVGLVPYSFTVTSHIIVTLAMALVGFSAIVIIGFIKQGPGFLKMFMPSGVPIPMLILLVPIEIVSFFIRPITLSVRLFANMMAGHVLLKVFAGFVISLGVFGIVPLIGIVAMTALEVLIAVLQAYVFTVLICVYLNDALHAHH